MENKELLETLKMIAYSINDLKRWTKVVAILAIIIAFLIAALLYVSLNPPAATINLIDQ